MNRLIRIFWMTILLVILWGCASLENPVELLPTASRERIATLAIVSERASQGMSLIYPTMRLDGNRLMTGSGAIGSIDPIIIDLNGTPSWVTGVPMDDRLRWYAVMRNGQVASITISEEGQISQELLAVELPVGQPPVVDALTGSLVDWTNLQGASALTYPVVTGQGRLVWIDHNGDLVVSLASGEEIDRVEVHALPDARLVLSGDLVAFYAEATHDYDHAILGDGLEGGQLVVLDTSSAVLQSAALISPPTGNVFEGLSPMIVDWNQDGQVEILATVSNLQSGARFVLYGLDGSILAESEPIGQGYRWRHQIAIFAFEVDGEPVLASVLRPHLDGTVQLHAWRGDQLVEMASLAGYSSHRIGERNLDQAAAADFDGDGTVELMLGDLQMDSLVLLSWNGTSLVEEGRFPLSGILVTNIGMIETPSGGLVVAVGTDDGRLLVWGVDHR